MFHRQCCKSRTVQCWDSARTADMNCDRIEAEQVTKRSSQMNELNRAPVLNFQAPTLATIVCRSSNKGRSHSRMLVVFHRSKIGYCTLARIQCCMWTVSLGCLASVLTNPTGLYSDDAQDCRTGICETETIDCTKRALDVAIAS